MAEDTNTNIAGPDSPPAAHDTGNTTRTSTFAVPGWLRGVTQHIDNFRVLISGFVYTWAFNHGHSTIKLISKECLVLSIALAGVASNFSTSSDAHRGFVAIATTYSVLSATIYTVILCLLADRTSIHDNSTPQTSIRSLFAAGNACIVVGLIGFASGLMVWSLDKTPLEWNAYSITSLSFQLLGWLGLIVLVLLPVRILNSKTSNANIPQLSPRQSMSVNRVNREIQEFEREQG
jgi:hypothetical protein